MGDQSPAPFRSGFEQKKKLILDITSKLSRRKSQLSLLESATNIDILSSIRPQVGKVFTNSEIEKKKLECLENCRVDLVKVAIEDAEKEIGELTANHAQLFETIHNEFPKSQYLKLCKAAKDIEHKILYINNKKHCKKINAATLKSSTKSCTYIPPSAVRPVKHIDTKCRLSCERNRRRRTKDKLNRNHRLSDRVNFIKNNGLVVNFTNIDIPDGAYLFLAKGNSFVPAVSALKHDLVFDTGEFLRKLAWRTYFHSQSQLPAATNPPNVLSCDDTIEKKLHLQSFNWPPVSSKLFDYVSHNIKHFVDNYKSTDIDKYKNLTYMERQGLFWCLKMKRQNILHFSQADKGGATVVMDPLVVNNIIMEKLNDVSKFQFLRYDPRPEIELNLLTLCKEQVTNNGMSNRELFLITGHTGKGKSHNPKFKAGKPNPFPLFKLHSLQPEEVAAKSIPPVRLVTSMKFSATKRLSVFLDAILNPVAQAFCSKQYLKGTTDFLQKLVQFEEVLVKPGVQLFSLDVKALYPSINPHFVPIAVEMALDVVTDFSKAKKKMVIEFVKFSISNACIHYRDRWYKMLEGVPTGGSDSVCLANIYVKWVLLKFNKSKPATVFQSNFCLLLRFIDDFFGGWAGTYRQFKQFITVFNNFGKHYGVIFDKEQFGDSVTFLDVLVSNSCGHLVTDLYFKPTDARRYLHRNSFHPAHTFRGIPFSQMRRAALICSNDYLRDYAIDEMCKKFLECGYKESSLIEAKKRVQLLKRSDLLKESPALRSDDAPLIFVLSFSVDAPIIKQHVDMFSDDIKRLTGTDSIVFSMKRNSNVSSLLFNKYGFAQTKTVVASQKCGVGNCSACVLKRSDCSYIDLQPNFTIKPSKFLTCKSDCVIYVARCKICFDFYFGKTMSEEHVRMNGHRDKFYPNKFDKSALAMHLFTDHPDCVGAIPNEGLCNFEVVLVEGVNAMDLRKREDYYIWITQADLRHLNRYKVSR